MLISQFGKIIRIETIRAAGRSTSGVKLLDLDDKVAAAMTTPEERKTQSESKLL